MHSLVKEQKKSTFTVSFLVPGGPKNETAKLQNPHSKGRPLQQTKKLQLRLFKQPHIDLKQRRPAHAKPDFN